MKPTSIKGKLSVAKNQTVKDYPQNEPSPDLENNSSDWDIRAFGYFKEIEGKLEILRGKLSPVITLLEQDGTNESIQEETMILSGLNRISALIEKLTKDIIL